jgi:saccharopine dehydrogenase (NADP+, L-glutamate forming)
MNKILVLGTGAIARPLIRYLLAQTDAEIIVAGRYSEEVPARVDGYPKEMSVRLDINNTEDLEALISAVGLTINLLPSAFHLNVAEACLKYKTHLITTSYISPAMNDLHQRAQEAGVLFLFEIGLDPGLDHMVAMRLIHEVASRRGKIISLESCCGDLPVPEVNDNPFGFKFWRNPRNLLLDSVNNARYRKESKEINIPAKNLFRSAWLKNVKGLGNMEVYPNRDALIYQEQYNLKEPGTFLRGIFRYPGWCETMNNIVKIGFFDDTNRNDLSGKTFREIVAACIGKPADDRLEKNTVKFLNIGKDSLILKRMEWLGLFSLEPIRPDVKSLLDILATRMMERMSYRACEQDMVVLQHDLIVEYRNAGLERISSLLLHYGTPDGDSAMSRTVGLPAAIAAKLLLQKKVKLTGIRIPIYPEIYQPILAELEEYNIKFRESVTRV